MAFAVTIDTVHHDVIELIVDYDGFVKPKLIIKLHWTNGEPRSWVQLNKEQVELLIQELHRKSAEIG